MGQTFLNFGHNVRRQVFDQVSDFVGVQAFDSVHQLVAVHGVNQGFSNTFIDFNQNFAVASGAHAVPNDETFIERKGFQNVGDIGRVQFRQSIAKLFFDLFADL